MNTLKGLLGKHVEKITYTGIEYKKRGKQIIGF